MPKSNVGAGPLRCGPRQCFVEVVRFYPNTAADPTYDDPGACVDSIVHSATGKYTITWREDFYRVLAVVPSISVVGDATDATVQVGVKTDSTLVVKTKTGAANADFAADADTHVDLLVFHTLSLAARE